MKHSSHVIRARGRWRFPLSVAAGVTRAGREREPPSFQSRRACQSRRRCASVTPEGIRQGLNWSSLYRTRGRNAGGAPADARSLPWAGCTLADRWIIAIWDVTYGPWARAYSKLFSCKPVLTVCSYGAQSNEICTYGRVSRGSIPRVRRYGLLFLQTVEYDQYYIIQPVNLTHRIMGSRFDCTKGLGKITLCSAVQSPKSWVAQRTTHGGWLGGPYYLWVVRICYGQKWR